MLKTLKLSVSSLGKSYADAVLSGTDCSHCESFSLVSLCSWIAFFSESDSAPRVLPFSSSQGPVRKKEWGRGLVHSPLLFTQHDQRLSAAARDMISFGVSDNELDDSLSLAASVAEELSGSVTDPAFLPSSASRNARLRADEELIRIMTEAVNELGLEWCPPESTLVPLLS